jgi:hypothetical protein
MLAVLNSDSKTDDARALLETFSEFEVGFIRQDRGLKVTLKNAPADAFVDGNMIRGTRELLSAVLRDIVFTRNDIFDSGRFDLDTSDGITNAIFHIVRNARLLSVPAKVDLVVCWGGHAISREEYDYSKQVGYELGLRGLNVCTGCGPGAMKGPMKGATIGHAKQRIRDGRYVGITEPGIIAAESPNPIPTWKNDSKPSCGSGMASSCFRGASGRLKKFFIFSACCCIRTMCSNRFR